MSDSQSLIVKGHVDIKLYNQYGEVIDERSIDNTMTRLGGNILTQKAAGIMSPSFPEVKYMRLGTGTPTTTSLQTPVGTVFDVSLSLNSTIVPYSLIWTGTALPGNGTGIITEAALISSYLTGRAQHLISFDAINKGSADTLTLTWEVSFL